MVSILPQSIAAYMIITTHKLLVRYISQLWKKAKKIEVNIFTSIY